MHFDHLPAELVLQIFRSCDTILDVLNLAAVNRRCRRIFQSSQKLTLLMGAAEAEFGPVEDIIQMVTQNASQPAHVRRHAALSMPLLKQIVEVGRVAKRWEEIYPLKKWKTDYENRRLLTDEERFRLRRAVYRLWLYHRAFHNRAYDRFSRCQRSVIMERAQLLHNWSTEELAEIEDLRMVIQDVIENNICPSNGTIQRKYRKRHPDTTQPLTFNIQFSSRPSYVRVGRMFPVNQMDNTSPYYTYYHHSPIKQTTSQTALKLRTDPFHDPGDEGWGDEIPHYYVVQDMLKLDPGQVLYLQRHAPLKEQVESYVRYLGEDWFRDNGETFGDTLAWVMRERGEEWAWEGGEAGGIRGMIERGLGGIALKSAN
ncbi:hypothetical protein VTN31DRAFT_1730 [Thermomyces dupontii]|uniref:uncharacterized protein n=1 Tax=Talaromyces thermophilus TaxID=28565 RepID=UPI0037440391